MTITLIFNSSQAAENAFEEYFTEQDCSVVQAILNRKEATIAVETFTAQTSILDIPEGLISIII